MQEHPLAIIAGSGALPLALARAAPGAAYVTFAGVEASVPPGMRPVAARFERLGAMFAALRAHGIRDVAFAGAMHRPEFDTDDLDSLTAELLPGLAAAMGQGDDALLRHVIAMFEDQGFRVRGPAEVAPGLVFGPDEAIGRAPDAAAQADAARGLDILAALGPQDVGQAVVVEAGLCLGIETLQGTDALLRFVADTPAHLRRGGGVLVKAPKPGQDRRIDLPTIGPATVEGVARAGLAGLFVEAGGVLVLEREAVARQVHAHGLFLVAL